MGVWCILATGPTRLTSDRLDDIFGSGGLVKYSQLSSVAHCESFAINGFLDVRPSDEVTDPSRSVTLTLPRKVAIEFAI